MSQTCYRVCESLDGRLYSIFVLGPLCAEYKIGEWTHANATALALGYGLCVYTSLDAAKKEYPNMPIYECETGELFETPMTRIWHPQVEIGMLQNPEAHSEYVSGTPWNGGEEVRMTDRIMLVKKVWPR